MSSIVWFRSDLRLTDNPALDAAVARGESVVPLFVWAPGDGGAWTPGSASRWWLHQSLAQLDASLHDLGSRLVLRRGSPLQVIRDVATECGATAVFWNRRYEAEGIRRDEHVKSQLRTAGLEARSFNAALLYEPWEIRSRQGKPYQVFGPYWRSCLAASPPRVPTQQPKAIPGLDRWPKSNPLHELRLEPVVDWAGGMRETWCPGEKGALAQLARFLDTAFASYTEGRDRPAATGTSRLSPHLHFGEIGPRQVWHAVDRAVDLLGRDRAGTARAADVYLREIGWREFAHHLLFHFPQTVDEPLRPEFAQFPWDEDAAAQRAWQKGNTGYSIVDAGMRELWTTGWMHNRVRMIVASFLVKDLLIPWQSGARWFWDTLVDADLANNTLGWQWTAGCGADAAPYFRIFNPVTQGEKFDPGGEYVRRWVPELTRVPDRFVHRPWCAPETILSEASVRLGRDYPFPIVDHAVARSRALAAFDSVKRTRSKE